MIRTNELRVDRSLLIDNFETYKLSLEKFPISKENIPGGVRTKQPNDNQYSFLHHKEFSLHNHLYGDKWNENGIYLITSEGSVKRALINLQTERIFKLDDVWEFPYQYNSNRCNFNASVTFPTSHLAVVSDGIGYLYIVDTSDRTNPTQWKTLYCEEVLGEGKEFKVSYSLLEDQKSDNSRKLHCVLHLIETTGESKTPRRSSGYETVLKWIVFKEGSGSSWDKILLCEFRGHGSPDYVALEKGCQGLYLISDAEFQVANTAKIPLLSDEQNGTCSEPDYHWQQTKEDVKVWFTTPDAIEKTDVRVSATFNFLDIALKDTSFLSGTLCQRIDPELTLWTLNNSKVVVEMQKVEPGVVWTNLLKNSSKVGKEVINEEFVAEIHEKLAHLCSENEEKGDTAMLNSGEMEECDAFGETRFLSRFQAINSKITHKIVLGSEQWLFSVQLTSDELPAFCIRRDVDGILWQPVQPQMDNDIFQCTHIHTFPALGYIAASRQDKKFLLTPSSKSYVAIINTRGHVIVFRKTNLSSGSVLRNRKTSTTTDSLFVQNLVNLETNSQVVGAVASDQYLFVLTSDELIMVNIK
ncbi:nudC domain-containing protein 1 isoform X2 [Rhodnius prolixus]